MVSLDDAYRAAGISYHSFGLDSEEGNSIWAAGFGAGISRRCGVSGHLVSTQNPDLDARSDVLRPASPTSAGWYVPPTNPTKETAWQSSYCVRRRSAFRRAKNW